MIEQEIISDVADLYGITVDNILSRRRIRRYVEARSVVSYILYYVKGMTTIEVGEILNRTHASILYFNRNAKDWLRTPLINERGACAIRELEKRYKTKDV